VLAPSTNVSGFGSELDHCKTKKDACSQHLPLMLITVNVPNTLCTKDFIRVS